jgi:hypothetical protein
MGVPALRIPVALNLDSLQQQTKDVSDRVGGVLRRVTTQFLDANKEMLAAGLGSAAGIASGWASSALKTAGSFAAMAAGAAVAWKTMGSIVDSAREQLEKMVAIADKASERTVSPLFFQAFVKESEKLKVSAEELEGALTHAFQATKDVAPVDLNKWETGEERITGVEKALRVYNETLAKTAGQQLDGLVLFRDAQNQDQKIQAVLKAMIQLEQIGQRAAALDLGEKMFGSALIDRMRQGKTSAQEILETVQKTAETSPGVFSEDMVKRAKEVDDQLKLAQQHLSQELKPTWEGIADTINRIKSLWADVVELTAKAVALAGKLNPSEILSIISNPALGVGQVLGRKALDRALGNGDSDGSDGKPARVTITGPSRGTGAAPTLKKTDADDTRDRFETNADAIEKRTAALEAETRTINLGTEARERAKIAAELQTVAMQINKEAGLGENIVTAEQAKRIDDLAEKYGKAAVAIEQAKSPLATFARESENLSKQLNQFAATSLDTVTNELANVVTGAKSGADAFKAMANSIIQDLARIAIRKAITGPIAASLGSVFGFAGGGEVQLPGFDGGGLINGAGSATSDSNLVRVSDGEFIVKAREAGRNLGLLQAINSGRLPGFADGGMIGISLPSIAPSTSGDRPIFVQVTSAPVFQAGMTPTDIAAIESRLQVNNQLLHDQIFSDLRTAIANDKDTLSRG